MVICFCIITLHGTKGGDLGAHWGLFIRTNCFDNKWGCPCRWPNCRSSTSCVSSTFILPVVHSWKHTGPLSKSTKGVCRFQYYLFRLEYIQPFLKLPSGSAWKADNEMASINERDTVRSFRWSNIVFIAELSSLLFYEIDVFLFKSLTNDKFPSKLYIYLVNFNSNSLKAVKFSLHAFTS